MDIVAKDAHRCLLSHIIQSSETVIADDSSITRFGATSPAGHKRSGGFLSDLFRL